jgi:hypothetical protein
VAIALTAAEVRAEVAGLMEYRLRRGGFALGQGGAQLADFAADTTPSAAKVDVVVARNAALVSDDFPGAAEGDRAELVTIAALRSAIELEASAPSMDADRIRVWRDQLREYVTRAGDRTSTGSSSEAEPGARVLAALWSFGPAETVRAPGAEVARTATGEPLYDGGEPVAPAQRRRLIW